jgi:hypothetical protein
VQSSTGLSIIIGIVRTCSGAFALSKPLLPLGPTVLETALEETIVFKVEIVVGDPEELSKDGVIKEDDSEMEVIWVNDPDRL